MHDLGWLYRRLRAMHGRELIWRARRKLQSHLPSVRRTSSAGWLRSGSQPADWEDTLKSFRDCANRPVLLDRERAQLISAQQPTYVAELLNAADQAADFIFWFPGYPKVSLSQPVDWNHDPITDIHYPTLPSTRINYRTLPGDVAWMWRLNRLQHLPWLAQAWLFTGDDRYSEAAFGQLDSWINQNPPGRGVAWCGSFEAGLRAIAISIALQGLRDAPQLTPERFRRIIDVLAESAQRCWTDRSLFSSANNHLIGEMAGLATVAIMFPELRDSKVWEDCAIQTLSTEATKQVLADGVGAEQSICYQMFIGDLLHLVTVLLIQRDGSAPDPLVQALARSSSFLAALIGNGDPAPRYGDDDEGFALRLGAQPARTLRDHLGIVAASGFAPPGIAEGSDSLDAQWFRTLAQSAASIPSQLSSPEKTPAYGPSFVASEGGFIVLRNRNRRLTMDIGPLGYLSTAAHGHADALALTLSEDGKDLIGDPGTGSYYGHPGWRSALRGTRAHATVCVDGQDQSLAGGPYLWAQHAEVKTFGIDLEGGIVDAEHDGYARLPGGVVHRRWLVAPPNDRTLVIDLLAGRGEHSCEQNWPLHPTLGVEQLSGGHRVFRDGLRVLRLDYAASQPLTVKGIRGDEQTNNGWWSDPAEGRSAAWWLSASCIGELPLAMVALISPVDTAEAEGLSVRLAGSCIEAKWTEGERCRVTVVDLSKSAAVSLDSSMI